MLNFSTIRRFCTPALVYISIIALFLLVKLVRSTNSGEIYNMDVAVKQFLLPSILGVFWAWVLDLICKAGQSYLSWALVVVPYVVTLMTDPNILKRM
jgi:hypothetical protein